MHACDLMLELAMVTDRAAAGPCFWRQRKRGDVSTGRLTNIILLLPAGGSQAASSGY
jgi:hypothetical protein